MVCWNGMKRLNMNEMCSVEHVKEVITRSGAHLEIVPSY